MTHRGIKLGECERRMLIAECWTPHLDQSPKRLQSPPGWN